MILVQYKANKNQMGPLKYCLPVNTSVIPCVTVNCIISGRTALIA